MDAGYVIEPGEPAVENGTVIATGAGIGLLVTVPEPALRSEQGYDGRTM